MRTDIIGHIGCRAENLPCQKVPPEQEEEEKKNPTNQKPHNKNGNKTSRCKSSSTGITLDDKRLPALCSVCVEGRIPLCLIGSLPSREGWVGGSLFFLLLSFFILLLLLYIYITNLEPNKLRLSLSSLSPFEFECAILWVIWGGTEKQKKTRSCNPSTKGNI